MSAVLTLEEQSVDLGRKLASLYGDKVTVEYIDIYSPDLASHPAAFELLTTSNLQLPLVSINDEPRFAGGIVIDVIREALEKEGLVTVSQQA